VFKSRGPLKIWDFSVLQIVAATRLKVTMYPSPNNCLTEIKESLAIPGEKFALDAAALNSGMSKSAV
jgi:hypothetical protein